MKFLKLELENLASLDREGGETINFEEGALRDSTIFCIVGATGSGKSTILDAICLALYNRAPRYPRKKGDRKQGIEIYGEPEEGEKNRLVPTDARNILTRGKKYGYSKLTFRTNDGTIYRAEWSVQKLSKNYREAETALYKLTRTKEGYNEEPAQWDKLPDIIGLEYEQFLRTVIIAQGSFANFIKAKEDERYELLEKLIDCRDLFIDIANKIKKQKDDAVREFDRLKAEMSVRSNDILDDTELTALKSSIELLTFRERQIVEERTKIVEDLLWYVREEELVKTMHEAKNVMAKVEETRDAFTDQAVKLALHDATLPAVKIYEAMQVASRNIAESRVCVSEHDKSIGNVKTEIIVAEKLLSELKESAIKAEKELQRQKPHILKARELTIEIKELKKNRDRCCSEASEAELWMQKAEKELVKNSNDIEKAKQSLELAEQELTVLKSKTGKERGVLADRMQAAVEAFEEERIKLKEFDSEKLRASLELADKKLKTIDEAVIIEENLTKAKSDLNNCSKQLENLEVKNAELCEIITGINIDKLEKAVETYKKTYTLLTGENVELLRSNLKEGEACPVCGSTSHPYGSKEEVGGIICEMQRLIETKTAELCEQKEKKESLMKELSENNGKADVLRRQKAETGRKIELLCVQWGEIRNSDHELPPSIEELEKLRGLYGKERGKAEHKMNIFNSLLKNKDRLLENKDKAQKELAEYEKRVVEAVVTLDFRINSASSTHIAAMAKTENLKKQFDERTGIVKKTRESLLNAERLLTESTEMLQKEICGADPDELEQALEEAKDNAIAAVENKSSALNTLRYKLEDLQGRRTSELNRMEHQSNILKNRKAELKEWLQTYNSVNNDRLDEATLAALDSSQCNWEDIRRRQLEINEKLTESKTKLNKIREDYNDHQQKKPLMTQEELLQRKNELDKHSSAELTDAKASLQRHEEAKKAIGDLLETTQQAQLLKNEWEQINKAIGSDGSTLRKIAQCYTMRFLVEHANAEIRKFSNRYELQQVKNSLGLRVIDHDRADDVRDVTSLSGGETFIISLGLALGLSSLSTRNVGFNNLFIDEGFGSLDPDTLDTVIDSLSILQSSQGKKVCVISHTETMSERIGTRIRVNKKGNTGSSRIEIEG